jgi:site-specific recombinase XerD
MDLELKMNGEKFLSKELPNLQEEAKRHLKNSKSENTSHAYSSDWRLFSEWCEKSGLKNLPAEPETIVYYTTFLGKSLKASSIKRKTLSISKVFYILLLTSSYCFLVYQTFFYGN